MKKYLSFGVPILVTLACSLLFFTSLDNKIYDLLLRTIPSLTEDSSVLIITVDDDAIANTGVFPWPRDILADAIVFLREMGADTVAFDLNYLDRSPRRVDPDYVQNTLPAMLDNEFFHINEAAGQVLDGFSSGELRPSQAREYKEQLFDYYRSIRENVRESLSYVSRDEDEYFAQCLRFFGKSFLTLTMITRGDIQGLDQKLDLSGMNIPYLQEHIALKNISAEKDTLTGNQPGVLPSIFPLLSRAEGAGFVNAAPDGDGYYRRVHLVMKHAGVYYPHLALAALREMIGNPKIVVTNSSILLKDANIRGTIRDITIPRTRDGSVLIKWPKKPFNDYNTMSAWNLIRYNTLEKDFIRNLSVMESSGFFYYLDETASPLKAYNAANELQKLLSTEISPAEADAGNTGKDQSGHGINFEAYRAARQEYLDRAGNFLTGFYEENILADVAGNEVLEDFVKQLFAASREQFNTLLDIRKDVGRRVSGTLSVIGVNATSMTDVGLTTFQERFPNVGVYATLANMILSGEFLDNAPTFLSFIIALALSLGLGLLIRRLNDVGKSIGAGIIAIAISACPLIIFFIITKRYIGVAVPFASVTFSFLSLSAINFFSTSREKSFLRAAFSRYLAPQVVEQIISDPSKLNLGGEERKMTALFTDIRSFSSISEYLLPKDLVNLLNIYLTEMSDIILENRGTVDKYEGDAIIAFFGAPLDLKDHAALACRTAINIKKAEARLNARFLDEEATPIPSFTQMIKEGVLKLPPLFTRIGINTGDMIVGNMGTPNKMNYTIMGHAVNLAARMEGVNKQYNTGGILVTEYTRQEMDDEFVFRRLDRVRVVGVNTPIRIYELLEERSGSPEELLEWVQRWEQAMKLYETLHFYEAEKMFRTLASQRPEDMVANLYLAWSGQHLNNPPPPDWDGVINLTQK
ncbi:adenylate/guanylate cyclase catalytic domain protein [Treponema primitia ZAS-2]|uniref:Adenylate/guanylate cyclase catalytic domain protein n=1 Tax=Treponema primitia (strain ATCC BAA-887 / DSM 12427 / ZAS-2) TaxID=545694 RepID=F5YR29_TREPZ|nr:adenylate/guanylate cyclase domain-containing protein [Treponema primitia]AEF84491.1 adenylate/guanylate cyclase catalytic domain protein [Treponema primitia ZAS-2]